MLLPQAPEKEERDRSLGELSRHLLEHRSLIVASNRGPVEHRVPDGQVQVTRGAGGVVNILNSLSRFVPFTWIASARGESPRMAARLAGGELAPASPGDQELRLRYVFSPRNQYQLYYNLFSNPFLWFLQHTMWDITYSPNIDRGMYDAWEMGYVPVNRAFASAIISEATAGDIPSVIMIHDYHLYLVGGMVRERLPQALIQHFVHIPWPASGYWMFVPENMRTAILDSLCKCDIVGFQTTGDVRNFLLTCQDLVPGAEVDFSNSIVKRDGRTVYVRHYAASVDVEGLREQVRSARYESFLNRLRPLTCAKTIVRVDRMEPSKNILRGFRAYEMLLGRHPDLLGKVTFLAFLVPSRTDIKEYRVYSDEVLDCVNRINSTFSQRGWTPITVFHQENYLQAIAGMSLADVLLVNPIVDGMNLVAKEGPIVNSRDSVLILSQRAGAFEGLKPGVIPISPVDIEGTTLALYQALNMDAEERAKKASTLRSIIENADITHWLRQQLEDMVNLPQ